MRRLLPMLLLALGLLTTLAGMVLALRPLVGAYRSAMTDPLGDQGPADGAAVSGEMWPGIALMAVGVLITLGASLWLKATIIAAIRRRLAAPTPPRTGG